MTPFFFFLSKAQKPRGASTQFVFAEHQPHRQYPLPQNVRDHTLCYLFLLRMCLVCTYNPSKFHATIYTALPSPLRTRCSSHRLQTCASLLHLLQSYCTYYKPTAPAPNLLHLLRLPTTPPRNYTLRSRLSYICAPRVVLRGGTPPLVHERTSAKHSTYQIDQIFSRQIRSSLPSSRYFRLHR